MQFYVYISDAKVDMLYAQIPERVREKISTELKIDLKLASATFSKTPSETTRFSKLKVVTAYIEENEQVGSVDEPNNFFSGTMALRWGPVSDMFLLRNISHVDTPLVFWGGVTDKTFVGLGGSLKHVIGEAGTSNPSDTLLSFERSYSPAPQIIRALISVISLGQEQPVEPRRWVSELDLVEDVVRHMTGPLQKFSFLAKRLMYGRKEKEKSVLLGSPVYVALAE